MSASWSAPSRRSLLAISAVGGAAMLASPAYADTAVGAGVGPDTIRPFHVHYPEEALVDLRRRIAATQWPDRELVADASQGVQLATTRAVARYWLSDHD